MKRPNVNQLYLAAMWLDYNESEDVEERSACERTAEWLREQARAADQKAFVAAAVKFGIPRAAALAKFKEISSGKVGS